MLTEMVQQSLFDYGAFDTNTSAFLQSKAIEIRHSMRRTAEEMMQIGRNLLEVKARLPHGQFLPWVKYELGMSQSTAWRFMQIAQGKEIRKSFTMNDLTPQIEEPIHTITLEEWHAFSQEERDGHKALYDLLREWDPAFDAMLKAFCSRYEYVLEAQKEPEQDSCLGLMVDEINAYVRRSLQSRSS